MYTKKKLISCYIEVSVGRTLALIRKPILANVMYSSYYYQASCTESQNVRQILLRITGGKLPSSVRQRSHARSIIHSLYTVVRIDS